MTFPTDRTEWLGLIVIYFPPCFTEPAAPNSNAVGGFPNQNVRDIHCGVGLKSF